MKPRALVVSYNWETGETLTTPFEEDTAVADCISWLNPNGFLFKDFPESEGWQHGYIANTAAREKYGEQVAEGLRKQQAANNTKG